jgi:hypothetical protein
MSEPSLRRSMKIIAAAILLMATSLVPSRASAQTIWDQIKQEAAQKKAQQQQQKPQTPPKAAPASPPATPAAQPPADNAAAAGAAEFGTPDGTATIAASLAFVDIVGIKLGMPMQDAIDAAMAENKAFKQTVLGQACISATALCSNVTTPHETVAVSAVAPTESLFLGFTPPPSAQVVFSVKRQLKIPATSVDVLVASLRKKYGPESLNSEAAGNPLAASPGTKTYVWLFDLQGHLAAGDQAAPFVDCADTTNVAASGAGSLGADNAAINFDKQSHTSIAAASNGDPYPYPGSSHCVAVTAVTATMQLDSNGMTNNLAVEIASFPLLHSALRASWAGFDQQFKTVASTAPSRAPIPTPGMSSQPVSSQPTASQPSARTPIPVPGASAPAATRAPVPVAQPVATNTAPSAPAQPPAGADASSAGLSLDSSKLPDVLGIHLGMPATDAKAILQQHFAKLPISTAAETGMEIKGGVAGDSVAVDVTQAPDTPEVWHVGRVAVHQHVDHDTLIAALRQKYGKETFNGHAALAAQPVSDSQILVMEWAFDEQGNPVSGATLANGAVDGCVLGGAAREGANLTGAKFYDSAPTAGAQAVKGACASLVLVGVQLVEATDIVETFYTSAADLGLVNREAKATYASKQAQAAQKQQQDDAKAKLTKPTL